MKPLTIAQKSQPLSLLCIGAHADDIEIGAGGTILTWIARGVELHVHWCVLSAQGSRGREAIKGASMFLEGAKSRRVEIAEFRDGYFPCQRESIKNWFEDLKGRCNPDIILTHHIDDKHQDHRLAAELTYNTFRDHLVLGFEIPKWDGDLSRPNAYIALSEATMMQKIALTFEVFDTQRSKEWFDEGVFRGLARLRGMESRAPERYAEAFHASKFVLN
jgi:LmbE family N-acetylglucosaminyl deacetylase